MRIVMNKRLQSCSSEEGETSSEQHKRLCAFPRSSVGRHPLRFPSEDVICSRVEPSIRLIVSAAVEEAVSSIFKSRTSCFGTSLNLLYGESSRQLQLQFQSKLPCTLYAGSPIKAADISPVQLVLVDKFSNDTVKDGPLSSVKVQVVVMDGDFGCDGKEDWLKEEFDKNVVHARAGKPDLLKGDLVVKLINGIGQLGDLSFTDNSSWIRGKKFKLGARALDNSCTVREAFTGAFRVKDHRGELYRKHHPPSLNDEIWRLENIAKDGIFHKKLNENGINTVGDFRCIMSKDEASLRRILGMVKKLWQETSKHALECSPENKDNSEELACKSWNDKHRFNSAPICVPDHGLPLFNSVGPYALDMHEGPIAVLQQEPSHLVEIPNMQNCYSVELPFSSGDLPGPMTANAMLDNVPLSPQQFPGPVSEFQQEPSQSFEIHNMQTSCLFEQLLSSVDGLLPETEGTALYDVPYSSVCGLSISDYDETNDDMLLKETGSDFFWQLNDPCQIPRFVSQASSFPSSWARLLITIKFGKKLLAAKRKAPVLLPCC